MDGPLKGYRFTTKSSYEYILGNYEDPKVLETLSHWLLPTSVFYDLGANIGFHSLFVNRLVFFGKVYAFEPSVKARAVFEKHIRLNQGLFGVNRIYILPFAISDSEKRVEFTDNTSDGNTYIASSPAFRGNEKKILVDTYSIDELVQKGYDKPDVIKIDVEGAELDVLKGAIETIKTCRPRILLATHDWHLPGIKDACVHFLQDLGYTLQHTGKHNKQLNGLDDFICLPPGDKG